MSGPQVFRKPVRMHFHFIPLRGGLVRCMTGLRETRESYKKITVRREKHLHFTLVCRGDERGRGTYITNEASSIIISLCWTEGHVGCFRRFPRAAGPSATVPAATLCAFVSILLAVFGTLAMLAPETQLEADSWKVALGALLPQEMEAAELPGRMASARKSYHVHQHAKWPAMRHQDRPRSAAQGDNSHCCGQKDWGGR